MVIIVHVDRQGERVARSPQLRLGAFMCPVSIHTAAWCPPSTFPDTNFGHYQRFVHTLERGRLDAFFMADHRVARRLKS